MIKPKQTNKKNINIEKILKFYFGAVFNFWHRCSKYTVSIKRTNQINPSPRKSGAGCMELVRFCLDRVLCCVTVILTETHYVLPHMLFHEEGYLLFQCSWQNRRKKKKNSSGTHGLLCLGFKAKRDQTDHCYCGGSSNIKYLEQSVSGILLRFHLSMWVWGFTGLSNEECFSNRLSLHVAIAFRPHTDPP